MNDFPWTPGKVHPKQDPRTVDELISITLSESDEDVYWDAIGALHWRGSREVLERASELCRSFCAFERTIGTHILGQLGAPDRTYPKQCLRLYVEMLERDRETAVISSILIALSHLHDPAVIGPALRFRHDTDADVRYGVVFALTGHDDPRALGALIELTRDRAAHVRDWATFALGTQVDVDTPELRDALVDRLSDPDDDARGEALVGLARRGDPRVLPALRAELASRSVGTLAIEAAELIGDPQLLPDLIELRDWWDLDVVLVTEAINACSSRL